MELNIGVFGVGVAPFAGVWIEIKREENLFSILNVAPFAGVWIEIDNNNAQITINQVAPFAGVWIEISSSRKNSKIPKSHPSRVCGLK